MDEDEALWHIFSIWVSEYITTISLVDDRNELIVGTIFVTVVMWWVMSCPEEEEGGEAEKASMNTPMNIEALRKYG